MIWLLLLALTDDGPQPTYLTYHTYKSEALCEAAGEEIKARLLHERGWKISYRCVDSGSPPVWR
jgi:hypothetical protein